MTRGLQVAQSSWVSSPRLGPLLWNELRAQQARTGADSALPVVTARLRRARPPSAQGGAGCACGRQQPGLRLEKLSPSPVIEYLLYFHTMYLPAWKLIVFALNYCDLKTQWERSLLPLWLSKVKVIGGNSCGYKACALQ